MHDPRCAWARFRPWLTLRRGASAFGRSRSRCLTRSRRTCSERAPAPIIAQHRHSHQRRGHSSVGLVFIILMGRIKSGRASIDRRDHERLPYVEDHTFALVRRGVRKPSSLTSATRSYLIVVPSAHRRCAVLSARFRQLLPSLCHRTRRHLDLLWWRFGKRDGRGGGLARQVRCAACACPCAIQAKVWSFCRCDQVCAEYQSDVGWCRMAVAACLYSYGDLKG
jgi:hypothetical protein